MKLYKVPRNSVITLVNDDLKTKYLFHHVDGMYSYCTCLHDDSVVHFAAWTEVEIVCGD